MGDDDGEGEGREGGEAERAVEGFGRRIPMVWGHHEEAMAADRVLKVERGIGDGKLQSEVETLSFVSDWVSISVTSHGLSLFGLVFKRRSLFWLWQCKNGYLSCKSAY